MEQRLQPGNSSEYFTTSYNYDIVRGCGNMFDDTYWMIKNDREREMVKVRF